MQWIKIFICTMVLFVFSKAVMCQNREIDSLKALLAKATDTVKVNTLIHLGEAFANQNKNEKALSSYLEALKLAETIQDKLAEYRSLLAIGYFYEQLSKHELAMGFAINAKKIADQQGVKENIYDSLDLLALITFNEQHFDKSIEFTRSMLKMAEAWRNNQKIMEQKMALGDDYRAMSKPEKSLEIYKQALAIAIEIGDKQQICNCLHNIGLIYQKTGQFEKKLMYFLKAYNEAVKYTINVGFFAQQVSDAYLALNNYDMALLYAKKSLESIKSGYKDIAAQNYYVLKETYVAKRNYKEAYNYLSKYTALNDSLNSIGVQNKMNLLQTDYNDEKQARAINFLQKQADLQSELKNVLIAASVLLLAVVLLIATRYRQEKRSEAALASKNQDLNHTLNDLRSTQTQLIHAEKMASLGELTAGIAHEIQNPLNFVNNFSEVNQEMIDELEEELNSGNIEEALAIAADIKQNEQKINHHGKRADAIVKGMLEHSRAGSGVKEPTDINKLADEYLRLSYHGLRAKDKSFNVELVTNFDEGLPPINVIPQDIGRVLLNLFNNAFYAVNQKAKKAGADYKPEVSVTTSFENGKFNMVVKDNGIGIPDTLKEKIMQPFFTTKPTGEGTGLGLSLSYDIVVKGHGGSIEMESKEGEGSVFIIKLLTKW